MIILAKNDESKDSNENIVIVRCGDMHTLVISNQMKVYSWGHSKSGALGVGVLVKEFKEPTEI